MRFELSNEYTSVFFFLLSLFFNLVSPSFSLSSFSSLGLISPVASIPKMHRLQDKQQVRETVDSAAIVSKWEAELRELRVRN